MEGLIERLGAFGRLHRVATASAPHEVACVVQQLTPHHPGFAALLFKVYREAAADDAAACEADSAPPRCANASSFRTTPTQLPHTFLSNETLAGQWRDALLGPGHVTDPDAWADSWECGAIDPELEAARVVVAAWKRYVVERAFSMSHRRVAGTETAPALLLASGR